MSGSDNGSDRDSSPVGEFFSQVPKATGEDKTPVPDAHAAGKSDSSGGQGAKPNLPPPAFPQRAQQPQGLQAGKQPLKPPYETSKVADGQPTKSDYAAMSGSKVVETCIAQAVRDAAVAAATALHLDDPQAASMAVADAMQSVLVTRLTPSDTLGRGESERTTPYSESKFTQQAILSGICDQKDLDKAWEREKGSLYKNAK